jgi:sugar lactone lactonase YvrE
MGGSDLLSLAALVMLASPTGTLLAATQQQLGNVKSGGMPLVGSAVTLYSAGAEKGSGAVALATAQSGPGGFFKLSYTPPPEPDAVLYLVADGPEPGLRLATVLGAGDLPKHATINERTTVATAYAMAQFIAGAEIGGNDPGVRTAAATLRNLVNLNSGQVGSVLNSPPNGSQTSTKRAFNSLANMLAACVQEPAACPLLFALATPPGGPAPLDTLQAAVNIAHYPWQNALDLWGFSLTVDRYTPALDLPPQSWILAIKYAGNGHEFDGPGNMAFDADGNIWITNNYGFRVNHALPTCGGKELLKLKPNGEDFPGAPYTGGGIDGAGFGITLDPDGNVWVGNFGFYGSTCPECDLPPADSVSHFSPEGVALSPGGGYTQGGITSPQGTVSDQEGNIWIANTCNGTVTQYAGGNPGDHWIYEIGPAKPFDIAIDAEGNGWLTDNLNDCVYELSPDGALIAGPICDDGIRAPLGIAIDSLGNVWVANSEIIPVPCPEDASPDYGDLLPDPKLASITQIDSDGVVVGTYHGGGLGIPWGIAVDGNDNIWVADFRGERLSHFCGANPANCPPGYQTGQPIAPDGYHSDGLVRNTGVVIDASGNVWVANNWLIDPVQTNPGGDGMVVFIGLAPPVKTPLIGPPRQP